jgi:hypothetical protein
MANAMDTRLRVTLFITGKHELLEGSGVPKGKVRHRASRKLEADDGRAEEATLEKYLLTIAMRKIVGSTDILNRVRIEGRHQSHHLSH